MVRVLKPMDLCVILALHVDKRAVVRGTKFMAWRPSTNFNRSEVAGTFFFKAGNSSQKSKVNMLIWVENIVGLIVVLYIPEYAHD
jgi:hypothetical protein